MTLQEEAEKQIHKLKALIGHSHLQSDSIVKKEYNYEFNVTRDREKIKLLVYFGKKGIKVLLQGNENSSLYSELNQLINDQQELLFAKKEIDEPDNYIGSDEAGKGDLFGPLVVAAVSVNTDTIIKLKKIGVRDSKELSDTAINSLAVKIKKIVGSNFSIVSLDPITYNKLYDKFKNLNKLLNWAHSKSLKVLLDKNKVDTIVTDKFSNSHLDIANDADYSDVEFLQIEKGERFIGVAAASIIARNNFNEWFSHLSMKGIDLPKGSSETAISFLKNIRKDISDEKLNSIAKMHFKTIKNIS